MRNRLLNLYAANAKRGAFRAEGSTIFLHNVIVGSETEAQWWGGVSPEAFAKALAAIEGDVTVRINSPGGDVFGARAMVQAMREHAGAVNVIVDGWAASAASVVAVAGDRVTMAEGAFMMIHKSWTITVGNSEEHSKSGNLLEQIDASLAETYAARGNLSAEEFAAMMAAETWFNPDAAIEAGLADEKVTAADSGKARARWNMGAYSAPPADPVSEAKPEPPAPEPDPSPAATDETDCERERRVRVMRARLAASQF